MKININDHVWFTLTDIGRRLAKEYYDGFKSTLVEVPEEFKSKDMIKDQLWHLFTMFGSRIYNGMGEAPFVDNVIYTSDPSKDRVQLTSHRKVSKEGHPDVFTFDIQVTPPPTYKETDDE